MAVFSDYEINEAKRRVREMQNKASSFVGDNESRVQNPTKEHAQKAVSTEPEENDSKESNEKGDSSLFIILALIMLLSKENADSSLIIALLYLLL